ncbi:hypothetical protein FACS189415_7760 [Bacteroidia bacterium]|nr:hypothetical protein FACS189415_7760 [Bacteroidia bacterium]
MERQRDLRSFRAQKQARQQEPAPKQATQESLADALRQQGFGGVDAGQTQQLEQLANQFSGKSERDIMADARRIAAQQKREGKLDNQQIDQMAGQISGMLTPEQQQKLAGLVEMLKGE